MLSWISGASEEVMLLPHHIMPLCFAGASRETISSTWKPKSLEGTLTPWPPREGAGHQAAPHKSLPHQAELLDPGHGQGPPGGSSNSPSPHPSRINTSLPALPGLLLSQALVVWQGFGQRGAQTPETPLRSTRHTACHPSTFPESRGQGRSRKKGKQIAKMSRGRLPTGWSCSSHAGVGAGELLGCSGCTFSQ